MAKKGQVVASCFLAIGLAELANLCMFMHMFALALISLMIATGSLAFLIGIAINEKRSS